MNAPPLKSLKAFEVAARLLSFSKAAEELYVTPGAVSQQIKLLESILGVELFKRKNRRILLTDAGQCLLPGIQQGFQNINEAVESIKLIKNNHPITISAAPSFASKWLVPRLRRLQEKHPQIEIRIDTSMDVVDLTRSDIDIGIRFGGGNYPGMQTDLLICEEVYPVCSPDLIDSKKPLANPSDLLDYPLLHYATANQDLGAGWPDWNMWLTAAGVDFNDEHHGLTFIQQQLLIQSALESQGVALVGSVSVIDDIRSGKLIKPFELTFELEFSYYFVTTQHKANWPAIIAIREWILEEARSYSI